MESVRSGIANLMLVTHWGRCALQQLPSGGRSGFSTGWVAPPRPGFSDSTAMPTTGEVWAGGEVTVTREENKPPTVEIKVGEEVRFVNASGSTAHVWFAGNDAIRFYAERPGARVKFGKLGTYEYTVHVTAGAPRAGWVLGFVRDTRALPGRGGVRRGARP